MLRERIMRLFTIDSMKNAKVTRTKTAAIFVIFSVILVVLLGRIAWIQFVRGSEYQKAAYAQQNTGRIIPAMRGTIYDRNGNVLAISVTASQVNINQQTILKEGKARGDVATYQNLVASGLAQILELDQAKVLEKVQSSGRYKEIIRKIDVELGEQVKAWIQENKIKGVYVDSDVKRQYPYNSLACHVVGFTGRDDQGLVCGVEVALDNMLAGKAGRIVAEVDASGNELPFEEVTRIDPQNGYNATLTIDVTMQAMVEQALEQAVLDYGLLGGAACLVMDPNTGDIYAMASNPYFDLNSPYDCPAGMDPSTWTGNTAESVQILSSTVWRNKTLTDTYEPGSTFKAITAAAALEESLITAQTMVSDAPLNLAGWTIRCWRKSNDHGEETFAKAVANSCNPVFAKLSLKLGINKFYQYMESFGFRQKTGILLSGEADSIFHENPTEIDMAVTAFGQRVQITPIQLVSAYCAIANGGNLMKPRIVKELTDQDGNVVKRYDPEVIRQVLSEESANQVLSLLEGVVDGGTGSNAYVPGYRVAGKTGTSQTTESETTGRYIASFCGIAPVDNPQIVLLLVLDHPTNGNASGGSQAAPIAGDLIERILEYLDVERRYTESDKEQMLVKYYTPSVSQKTLGEAIETLEKQGLTYKIVGESETDETLVLEQMPPADVQVAKGSLVILYTSPSEEKQQVRVPDLSDLTLDEVYNTLLSLGLNMQANSKGTVVSQSIPSGTYVDVGSVIKVELMEEDVE